MEEKNQYHHYIVSFNADTSRGNINEEKGVRFLPSDISREESICKLFPFSKYKRAFNGHGVTLR